MPNWRQLSVLAVFLIVAAALDLGPKIIALAGALAAPAIEILKELSPF